MESAGPIGSGVRPRLPSPLHGRCGCPAPPRAAGSREPRRTVHHAPPRSPGTRRRAAPRRARRGPGAGRPSLGDDLGGVRAGALSGRQPVGAARAALRLPLRADRRPRSDAPSGGPAQPLGPPGALPLLQRVRHQAPVARRRIRRPPPRRRRGGHRHQQARSLRGPGRGDHPARRVGLERPGRPALRRRPGLALARRPQARGQRPRRRRERADDLARQGAPDLLCHRARRRGQGPRGGRGAVPVQHGLLVLPGRARRHGARGHAGGRGARRLRSPTARPRP